MKIRLSALLAAVGLTVAGMTLAPSAAHATDITNPAQHPYPITVVVDGQTYHDGLDTLPGFDDYACTAIPGVQYDFADNEVIYPDGQVAPWTEWQRIPAYQTWLKQQQAAQTTKPKSGSGLGKTTGSGKASGAGKTSGSSASGKGSAPAHVTTTARTAAHRATKGSSSSPSTSPSATASTTPKRHHPKSTPSAGSSPSASTAAATGSSNSSGGSGSTGSSATNQTAATSDVATVASGQSLSRAVTSTIGQGAGDTSLAGYGVLAGLVVVSAGLLLGIGVRRRFAVRRG